MHRSPRKDEPFNHNRTMRRFYRNEYLFSEMYLHELTQLEEDAAVRARLNTLAEYREYADTSSLTAWNHSFVHEMLQALGFGVRPEDDHVALLYQPGNPEQVISLCYSLLPTENPDNTRMGQHWAERIIRQLRAKGLHWGILTNGEQWRIYHTEEPTPYEHYLEIDLAGILQAKDVGQFQIFDQFMQAENFSPSPNPSHQGRGTGTPHPAPLPQDEGDNSSLEGGKGRAVKFSENACHCEESATKQSRVTGEIASQSLAMTVPFRENLTALGGKGRAVKF